MGDYAQLARLEAGEEIPLEELTAKYDPVTRARSSKRAVCSSSARVRRGEIRVAHADDAASADAMPEKILAAHMVGERQELRAAGRRDACATSTAGYSHEFTTGAGALLPGSRSTARLQGRESVEVRGLEDHLLYATGVPRMKPFEAQIETLRTLAARVPAPHGRCATTPRATG
jgi:hypothetical protein